MTITSLLFVLFCFIIYFTYYTIGKNCQWIVLLVSSILFYAVSCPKGLIFILSTAITIYLGANKIDCIYREQKSFLKENKDKLSKEERKQYKEECKRKQKKILIFVLLCNVGILVVFKYLSFAIGSINSVLAVLNIGLIDNSFNLLIPLGLSFYTFQAVAYLCDVYWEKTLAEKSFSKMLLFVSFFPQITQGPISRHVQLSDELFKYHEFEYKNFSWGFQRMAWGFFKKMVIADALAPCVKDVFANYNDYPGATVLLGAFLYSIQIYADFSGYMDIMCGFCEMLGIKLAENFERPYFSKSVTEYWRRWHITLGAWFRDYIYYPIGMAKWNINIGKKSKEKFGKHFGNTFPATLALIIVWAATGLWHGATWAYVMWGLVNGIFIIMSLWLEPVYANFRKRFDLDNCKGYKIFQIVRTFILITFIKVLPEVGTFAQGVGLWKHIFANHIMPTGIHGLIPVLDVKLSKISLGFAVLGIIVLFIFSVIQERGHYVREYFNRLPLPLRYIIMTGLLFVIVDVGLNNVYSTGTEFMYAQF